MNQNGDKMRTCCGYPQNSITHLKSWKFETSFKFLAIPLLWNKLGVRRLPDPYKNLFFDLSDRRIVYELNKILANAFGLKKFLYLRHAVKLFSVCAVSND